METENNINDLRVPSFSCYLKPIEDVDNMFDGGENFTDMAGSYSNNQAALLHRKLSSGGKRWFHGPCSTKKAVYVQQSFKKEDQFTFPVMVNPVQDFPRMSIEIFGSGTMNKSDITNDLVRKMSILSWDTIPTSKESVMCDDMASQPSSDLFEIENITRIGWNPSESRWLTRSTQYASREASIKWSFVTGNEKQQTLYNARARTKIEPPKNYQKKQDNGLLGCSSFKSVKVVEPVYKAANKSKK